MNARLDELEAKLTLAEDLLETLNMTVFRQQQQIDQLQAALRQLALQMQSGGGGEARRPEEEVPPHW
ncbi:SlyX family protein [Niveibacterium terrae]|uniref:SlyX family protein n=1 Tax=Niveibacterium terrae TaxID=3373598 RepID=UPI003A8C897D